MASSVISRAAVDVGPIRHTRHVARRIRIAGGGVGVVVALMSSVAVPAGALTKPTTREATGIAIAKACDKAWSAYGALDAVYGDVGLAATAARWRSYFEETLRVTTTLQSDIRQINPVPGADGGLTKRLLAVVSGQIVELKSDLSLLRKGRVSAAVTHFDAFETRTAERDADLQGALVTYGYPGCPILVESGHATGAGDLPLSIGPAYFPAVADRILVALSPAESTALQAALIKVSKTSKVYLTVDGRTILASADGAKLGTVVVFRTAPVVGSDPVTLDRLLTESIKALNATPGDTVAGFRTATASLSLFDKVIAVRSDTVVDITTRPSANQAVVKALQLPFWPRFRPSPSLQPPEHAPFDSSLVTDAAVRRGVDLAA